MNQLNTKRLVLMPLLLTGIVLSACEGESRPFQEAVEVATLGLTALEVVPPANSQAELVINRSQAIQMGINGISDISVAPDADSNLTTDVTLSASDRLWVSSNPSVASVSENGVVVGGNTDGSTQISVSIGGISSAPFPIEVNDSSLVDVSSIQGPETLELCLPQDYTAVGLFADDSLRTLTDGVVFSVVEGSVANVITADSSVASLNAMSSGALLLTATADNVFSATRQLNVLSNLESVAISPTIASVDVGDTFEFTATGIYNSVSGIGGEDNDDTPVPTTTRAENITANVNWQVVSGDDNASIGNSVTNGGELLGLLAGNAVVEASCGNVVSEQQSVVVNASTSAESDQLSFNLPSTDGILDVVINSEFALLVQRGSEFDEDDSDANLLVGELVFSVTSIDGGDPGFVINTTIINDGIVSGLTAGSVRVSVELRDSTNAVEASGSFTVRVTTS